MPLHDRLAELATLGATAGGIDRALFTAAERAARERFVAWGRSDGLHVEQDRAGNVFARLEPGTASSPVRVDGIAGAVDCDAHAPVQCGSHLDTEIGRAHV